MVAISCTIMEYMPIPTKYSCKSGQDSFLKETLEDSINAIACSPEVDVSGPVSMGRWKTQFIFNL
jgi:hypothetical protein